MIAATAFPSPDVITHLSNAHIKCLFDANCKASRRASERNHDAQLQPSDPKNTSLRRYTTKGLYAGIMEVTGNRRPRSTNSATCRRTLKKASRTMSTQRNAAGSRVPVGGNKDSDGAFQYNLLAAPGSRRRKYNGHLSQKPKALFVIRMSDVNNV